MISTPHAEPVPITTDADGMIRVGGTRVTLQTVILAHQRGDSPQRIIEQYPVLSLSDVYLVIGYYLQHQDEVDRYIQEWKIRAEQVRKENEARFNPEGVKDRLLERLQQKDSQQE